MSAKDRDVVVLRVREHLTLVEVATRRDLADPATATLACEVVDGDIDTFELRALTIADARAAGPAAWTDWRASLIDTLTGQVRERLTGRVPPVPPPAPTPVVDRGRSSGGLERTPARSGQGRSRRVDPDSPRTGPGRPLRGHRRGARRPGTDRASARLTSVGEIAADEWFVESPGGDPPEAARIVAGLQRIAAGDDTALSALHRARGRAPGVPTGGARAFVLPSAGSWATVIEVRAPDRPGLLHDLGQVLAEEGMSVRSAHISTFAGQTLDTFYLTDRAGEELAPAAVARAVSAVIGACDG